MWVVALGYGWWPYQTSMLQDHAWQSVSWLLPLGQQLVGRVNSSVQVQCVVAFKTYSVELLSSETLVCVSVSSCTYGDLLTTSQAEVPLEWIHAFYWEMGPFIPPFAILKLKVETF